MPSRKSLAKIHIAKKELNLTDEEYRKILYDCFGVVSSKYLTDQQADMLIAVFVDMGWKPKKKENKPKFKKYDELGDRKGFATPAQLRKIEATWKIVSREKTKKSLDRFLFRRFRVMKLENLPFDKVPAVLKALESMKKQCNCIGERNETKTTDYIDEPIDF